MLRRVISLLPRRVAVGCTVLLYALAARPGFCAPGGLSKLPVRSVDIMKWTKDTLTSQPSDVSVERLLDCLKGSLNLTHVAIAIPMDASEEYPREKPAPRSAAGFTQFVCDAIHRRGLKVIHRGTWCGIEGLYGFEKQVGARRYPAGSADAVLSPTPERDSWLGKTYQYIVAHPGFFADGDLWAVLPERTEGIFSDGSSFLPYAAPGIQESYARFFNDLNEVSRAAFQRIGKRVRVGYTANNFSEVKSGWLPQSLFQSAGLVAFDHYGVTHTPEELEADLRAVYESRGKLPLFHQEWGDYWNAKLPEAERLRYLRHIFDILSAQAAGGRLIGFSYWGGWTGDSEGLLVNAGTKEDPRFELNARGRLLAEYFGGNPGR